MTALQEYTHLPTKVQAIRVTRPFVAIEKAVPRAHRVTTGSGAFGYFQIANPGNNYGGNAAEGDWIVRSPTGTYVAVADEKFRSEYDVDVESNEPAVPPVPRLEAGTTGTTEGSARETVRDILFDRWDLDQIAGDPDADVIEETLDDIEAAYRL